MNQLVVIAPYRYLGMWVFDDPRVGLSQEPFVGGSDEILDMATTNIPNAEAGFRLVFSANQFPGANLHLVWRRAEMSGNVYFCEEFDKEGWVCPALLQYFESPPAEIYAQCTPLVHSEPLP